MDQELSTRILSAVDDLFDQEIAFLTELTSHPSTRGFEQTAQAFMADELKARGMAVDQWQINVDDISHLPGFSPCLARIRMPKTLLVRTRVEPKRAAL